MRIELSPVLHIVIIEEVLDHVERVIEGGVVRVILWSVLDQILETEAVLLDPCHWFVQELLQRQRLALYDSLHDSLHDSCDSLPERLEAELLDLLDHGVPRALVQLHLPPRVLVQPGEGLEHVEDQHVAPELEAELHQGRGHCSDDLELVSAETTALQSS